jgi:acetyl/propionyl-CoA carboxylase alpha subunit/acetyl-CoA carboxylase carboxyltransferase component
MDYSRINKEMEEALELLKALNPGTSGNRESDRPSGAGSRSHLLQKVLVANRGEIAKRFFLALHEESIPSVAVVTDPDRGQSWYEFADEVVFIGAADHYARIPVIIGAALFSKANAVYSGYGFLSENVDFVQAVESVSRGRSCGIIHMGPDGETMRKVGSKSAARALAREHGIPLFESSRVLTPDRTNEAAAEAGRIGYPVVIKPCSGGGGKGIAHARNEGELAGAIASTARACLDLYDDPSFYIERLVKKPVHIEVQIFNGRAIGIRKCAVQRRNQKIIEESGHAFLDDYIGLSLLASAEKIAHVSGYVGGGGAGTVEFLLDAETGGFGFMEMNARLQVEYAVTDQSLGIDIAKWQILFYDGRSSEITGLDPLKGRTAENDHSIECRIYAEEPENDYLPSPGTIIEMDLPTFNGIRCDFGFGEGDAILPMYDPMIGKLIAHGPTRKDALIRLERALQELYINGVRTNVGQLLRIVRHPAFVKGDYDNNILDAHPELNFRGPGEGAPPPSDRRGVKHVIFGAFAGHARVIRRAIQEFAVIANLGSAVDAPAAPSVPGRYALEYRSRRFSVEFVQKAMDTFLCFVDGAYNGSIILTSINDRCDDLLLMFGNSSYRIRVGRRGDLIDLRMKDEFNKINYYRMKSLPDVAGERSRIKKILSPFQGSFTSLGREGLRVGDSIEAGDPLMILSSMKMETVIRAPESGTIVHLIENGDLSRLLIAKPGTGKTIGRSVHENELLAEIETGAALPEGRDEGRGRAPHAEPRNSSGTVLDHILNGTSAGAADDHETRMKTLFELIHAAALGYIHQTHVIETLVRELNDMPGLPVLTDDDVEILNRIIRNHADIKQLFSPVVEKEGLSFREELHLYMQSGHERAGAFSESFASLIKRLCDSYGISGWEGRSEMGRMAHGYVLVLFKRAHRFSLDRTAVIKKIVEMISGVEKPGKDTVRSLVRLMEQEQAERDDSLLKFIKKILSSKFFLNGPVMPRDLGPFEGAQENDDIAELIDQDDGAFARSIADPGQGTAINTKGGRHPAADFFQKRLDELEDNSEVKTLYSPDREVIVCLLRSKKDSRESYAAFSRLDFSGGTVHGRSIESVFARAARIMLKYLKIRPCVECWVDIEAAGTSLAWDEGDRFIDYRDFKDACTAAMGAGWGEACLKGIITIDVSYPYAREAGNRRVLFYRKNDAVAFDLLLPFDRRSPFHRNAEVNLPNQRLLEAGKWPVEVWAEECFDGGTMTEIRIPSIDDSLSGPSSALQIIGRPVAARIYKGAINGTPACFYMKDSRISGGSTGSREGLKFTAAAYLSYLNDWPLYVWNDSAGANIMEGLVSLNRGAEGFMMNALLTETTDRATFRRYTANAPDPDLKKLFKELDDMPGVTGEGPGGRRRSFQLTAVGIGSSAGLDVYGSSQASIQIQLDSEESYRVLTGSKVVHTVIGEEITNYDIGGAKILGKWTGIVDIVASDKIELAACIRRVQGMFCGEEEYPHIRRITPLPEETKHESTVFTESLVRGNADDGLFLPFKQSYYAAETLIGGFARIGGRRVLIMGPRTVFGLRSAAAVIKARELLRAAYRTRSHQILIFGKTWQQHPDLHESDQVRIHLDFMNTVHARSGLRIHMITHPDGLKCFDINSAADVVIYIKSGTEPDHELAIARKNATFSVVSFEQAFDLACRLIRMLDPIGGTSEFSAPSAVPSIPEDPSEPYEIVESVIMKAFDAGSFVEFYREMNSPMTGPTLITGLAGLEGVTVGVIADQPLVKGGGADAPGTEKFRVFTELLNRNGIPLVMLSSSSGFVPGSQQERFRIQAVGAESLDVNILGTIPVVSVLLGQNYGGRLIHAFNKFLRPGIAYLALENSVMAVIGVDAAFDLLFGKKYERLKDQGKHDDAEELRREFTDNYLSKARASRDGVSSGLVDWTIPSVGELRAHLVRGLDLARRRCAEAFGPDRPEDEG